jgi:hypothetical protein
LISIVYYIAKKKYKVAAKENDKYKGAAIIQKLIFHGFPKKILNKIQKKESLVNREVKLYSL